VPVTRIISGLVGGRRIQVPPGSATRPTSDRVREALFSRLEHLDVLAGARVLDLYAGSGALGLEAASRGAAGVLLVESALRAADTARANVRQLGLTGVALVGDTVERVLSAGPAAGSGPYDLVLADPPYEVDEEALADVLDLMVSRCWLANDAMVVVERAARCPEPRWPTGLTGAGERRYGDTKMWFAETPLPPDVA